MNPASIEGIRFGVHAGQQHVSYADYLHLWQSVERMGYDWASVFDHFIPIMSDPEGPCFDGPTLLAGLAAHTRRIRCGILVIGNTYRHPAVLAKIGATVDHISGGRLELGIGAGWWELEHEEYGIPFPATAERIRMLGESIKIIKSLWTERRTTFHGRYYTLTDALAEPKPVQSAAGGHPPLWVGGAGERLTLRVVAESADGWNTFFMPVDAYQHKLDVLAEHCQRVGRDPATIRKSLVLQPLVGESQAEVQRRAEQIARSRGTTVEELRRSAVIGTPEECAEQLLRYVQLGVADFIVGARVPYDFGLLETFIERVAPIVRREAAAHPH